MNYKTPAAPPVVIRAFTAGLGNYVDPGTPLWSLLLKKSVALKWWSLDLFKIGKFDMTPSTITDDLVITTGWRFTAADGDYYGGCHVGSVTLDSPPILTGFSDDVRILTFMDSLEQLKALSVASSYQFELRTGDASKDIVIPCAGFVEGPPNHLDLMYPYPVQDFLTAIWPCVKRAYYKQEHHEKAKTEALAKPSGERAKDAAREQKESAQRIIDAETPPPRL